MGRFRGKWEVSADVGTGSLRGGDESTLKHAVMFAQLCECPQNHPLVPLGWVYYTVCELHLDKVIFTKGSMGASAAPALVQNHCPLPFKQRRGRPQRMTVSPLGTMSDADTTGNSE